MNHISITDFFNKEQTNGRLPVNLAQLLNDIIIACKQISAAVDKGALQGSMGNLESTNVQNEVQKALDVISNNIFIDATERSGLVAGMVSEEMPEPYGTPEKRLSKKQHEKYLLLFDPLDGSSNVNVNVSVGTIFSILKCPTNVNQPEVGDFLQPGTSQVCAGYALYGSSTMLVLTMGNGVNGFTLDRDANEFFLTHPDMRVPVDTLEFAINMSNQRFWEAPVQRYINECIQGRVGGRGVDFNMRWVASMVAEVHRILVRGGVFLYPIDNKIRAQGGKLRLLYEANPMSFIIEQAGGMASTGYQRILDIQPTAIHERVPVILGSINEVRRIVEYHKA